MREKTKRRNHSNHLVIVLKGGTMGKRIGVGCFWRQERANAYLFKNAGEKSEKKKEEDQEELGRQNPTEGRGGEGTGQNERF